MNKDQVAQVLTEIATLLELKGENPFKSRAYANAARAIESLGQPLETVFAPQSEARIKGIGESIHEKICELLATGKLAYYDELKNSIPPGLLLMLAHSRPWPQKGQGPPRQARPRNPRQLETACQQGKVAELAGFGEKTQANILAGINFRRQYASRHLFRDALARRRSDPGQSCANIRTSCAAAPRAVCGAARKSSATLIFWPPRATPPRSSTFFTAQPGIVSVTRQRRHQGQRRPGRAASRPTCAWSATPSFPSRSLYFTGSKEHNIVMRQRAIQRGLRLNEYGLFKSDAETRDPALLVPCQTEEEIFEKLGLAGHPARTARGPRRIRRRRKKRPPAPAGMDRSERLPAQPLHLERRPR